MLPAGVSYSEGGQGGYAVFLDSLSLDLKLNMKTVASELSAEGRPVTATASAVGGESEEVARLSMFLARLLQPSCSVAPIVTPQQRRVGSREEDQSGWSIWASSRSAAGESPAFPKKAGLSSRRLVNVVKRRFSLKPAASRLDLKTQRLAEAAVFVSEFFSSEKKNEDMQSRSVAARGSHGDTKICSSVNPNAQETALGLCQPRAFRFNRSFLEPSFLFQEQKSEELPSPKMTSEEAEEETAVFCSIKARELQFLEDRILASNSRCLGLTTSVDAGNECLEFRRKFSDEKVAAAKRGPTPLTKFFDEAQETLHQYSLALKREQEEEERKAREEEERRRREEAARKLALEEERRRREVEEREAKEREAKEREAREREAREREAREREAKEREAREREAKEREAREREAKEREAKEREQIQRQEEERLRREEEQRLAQLQPRIGKQNVESEKRKTSQCAEPPSDDPGTLPAAADAPHVAEALNLIRDFRKAKAARGALPIFSGLGEVESKKVRVEIKSKINCALNQTASTYSHIIGAVENLGEFITKRLRELPSDAQVYFRSELSEKLLEICDKGGQKGKKLLPGRGCGSFSNSRKTASNFPQSFVAPFKAAPGTVFGARRVCNQDKLFFKGMSAAEFQSLRGQMASESEEDFFDRMGATIRLWIACHVVKGDTTYLWEWIARFLNLNSEAVAKTRRVCASLLLAFFQVAGALCGKTYGRQFTKIVDLTKEHILPRCVALKQKNPSAIGVTVTHLEMLLDDFYKKGCTFPEPEGRTMKSHETELSEDV